jgi:hypothetical protein
LPKDPTAIVERENTKTPFRTQNYSPYWLRTTAGKMFIEPLPSKGSTCHTINRFVLITEEGYIFCDVTSKAQLSMCLIN